MLFRSSDVTILHGLRQHGITLLQKPFTAESLGEKVRQVLDTPEGLHDSPEHA